MVDMRRKLLNAIADFHSGGPEEGERILNSFLQALAEPSEGMASIGHAILFGRGANVEPHDFPDAFKAAIQHILDQEPNHE